MKTADIIIQARMGSGRLPGKIAKEILGKPMLEYVIERALRADAIRCVVVATSTAAEDNITADVSKKSGAIVYRGSLDDVLKRFYKAAVDNGSEHIVRIAGDCPLIDPAIIDKVVGEYFNRSADYCSNTLKRSFPDGQDVEVFNFDCLSKAREEALLASEREHVTPYITKNPNLFRLESVENEHDLGSKKWSVDELEDFEFVKAVIEVLYPEKPDFSMEDVLELLRRSPEIERINAGARVNEGYAKSLREDIGVRNE